MGKFNLLTVMTLDAVGFTDGINNAKKTTQQFGQGVQSAVGTISSQFSKLGGLAGGVTGQIGGIGSAVSAGTTAFKLMLPAINSVSMALISSGIGAIVVAIGIGVASLMSYLKGTSEGAGKLKIALAEISGVVNTLLQRMKFLGSALVDMFSGNWSKMKEDFANAFASGFLDEAKKNAEEAVSIAKEEIALGKQKRALQLEEAGIKKQIAILNYNARNMDESTKEGVAEKLKDVREEIVLTQKLFASRKQIADVEIAIEQQKQKNKYGDPKLALGEEKQALVDKQSARINLDSEYYDWLAGQQRLVGKLQKQLATENKADIDAELEEEKTIQDLKALGTELELAYAPKLTADKREQALAEIAIYKEKEQKKLDAFKITTLAELKAKVEALKILDDVVAKKTAKANTNADIDNSTENIKNDEFYLNLKEQLYKSYYDAGKISLQTYQDVVNESIKKANEDEIALLENKYAKGELLEIEYQTQLAKIRAKQANDIKINTNNETKTVQNVEKAKLQTMERTFGDMATASTDFFGKQSVEYKAFAIAQAGISTYLGAAQVLADKTVPFWLKPIAIGAIIGMGLANVAKIAGFAEGGIVGGSSFSGDNIHARVNSGEMILNRSQQANLFAIANGGGSSGGTVEFQIAGANLVGVLNNHNRRLNNFR